MGKFDILSNGIPFSMDKTKNYVKRDDGTVEEISDLANLANTEVGFIGHKANIHKAELTDRNISVLDEQKVDWDSVSSPITANTIPIRDTSGSINLTSIYINTADGLKECGVWNNIDKTYDFNLINGSVGQLFQEAHICGKAYGNITNGQVCMFAGAQGDHILISTANTSTPGFRAEWIVGVATNDIDNGDFGYVTWFGKVNQLNTISNPAGTILYLNPAVNGGLTPTKPTAPNVKMSIAAVVRSHATEGSLMVRPNLGAYLGDLHDVYADSPTTGDTLVWNETNSRWEKTAQSTLSVGNASTLESHSASYFATASGLSSHTGNTSNPHSVTATQVGLGNVENKSSATIRGEITSSNVTTALGYTPYNSTNPSGYTTNTGTVTSVGGTGSYGGLTLSGTVTGSGNLTLGGTPTGTWPISISGSSASCTGNAATATSSTNATGTGSIPKLLNESNLNIIRGVVNNGGGVVYGSGYSSTRTATGQMTITFSTAFAVAPTVIAQGYVVSTDPNGDASVRAPLSLYNVTTSSFRTLAFNPRDFNWQDKGVHFMTLGNN